MSCCGCDDTPTRLTNIFRHQELLEKFTFVTGVAFYSNTFICDPCVSQLESSYSFKEKCLQIYGKSSDCDQIESCSLHSETNEDTEAHDEEVIIYESEYVDIDSNINTEIHENVDEQIFDLNTSLKTRTVLTTEVLEPIVRAPITINRQAKRLLSKASCMRNLSQTNNIEQEVNASSLESKPTKLRSSKVRNRKSYSSGQKLEAVEHAEQFGNRQTAKVFLIDESCIRKWRLNKDVLIEVHQERGTKRKPNLHWPELDKTLKAWVKEQMNNGSLLKPAEIKAKSIELASTMNLTNFKGTSSYIFKFMERYRIPGRPAKNSKS